MKKSNPSALSVSVVGAGRLGAALIRALLKMPRYRIEAVAAKTPPAVKLPAGVLRLASPRLAELPPSDVLFIATPDDQINNTARKLAGIFRAQPRAGVGVALHASGALSSSALAPLRAANYAVGSLHPLVAVGRGSAGVRALAGASYCVEGERAAQREARRLVRALGGASFTIKPEHKALYHAAAVTAAGHLVALLDAAVAMLAACGIGERRARRLLLPLAASALRNLHTQPAARALTGPFARGDDDVVRQHLAALRAANDRNARDIYLALGQRELQLAARLGVSRAKLNKIARELAALD